MAAGSELLDLIAAIDLGERLADSGDVVRRAFPKSAEAIAEADDRAFQHPAIRLRAAGFLCDHPVDQLLFAWLPAARCRALHASSFCFDDEGLAFLPGLGMLRASHPATADGAEENDKGWEIVGNVPLGFGMQAHQGPSALSRVLLGDSGRVIPPGGSADLIRQGAVLIDRCTPGIAERMWAVTHDVLLFAAESRRSFVDIRSLGAVFIAIRETPTVPFFVEELAHQCGHVLFEALTERPESYFCAQVEPWRTPVTADDDTSCYVRLHGLVTLALMCVCLSEVCHAGELSAEDRLEAIARMTFAARRFERGASRLLDADLLQRVGLELVAACASAVRACAREHWPIASHLHLSGHGYDFSARNFRLANC